MVDELSSDEDPSDVIMSTSESEDKEGVGNACKKAKLGNKVKEKEKILSNLILGLQSDLVLLQETFLTAEK